MNIVTVRDAMRTALTSVTGLPWYEKWPGRLTAPAGIVERLAGPDRLTMGGGGTHLARMQVTLLAGPSSTLARSRAKLDTYLATSGGLSVTGALEANATLSGAVEALLVTGVESDDEIEANGVAYVGAHWLVEVYGL